MRAVGEAFFVQLTVYEQTGVPGKGVIQEPVGFEAFAQSGQGRVKETAYVTGGGLANTNATRSFWMAPSVAQQFKEACNAALHGGHNYIVTMG